MNETISISMDVTSCDVEPIHIPGSIQPHGLLLVADGTSGDVIGAAGDVEGRLAADWAGIRLVDLIGAECYAKPTDAIEGAIAILGRVEGLRGGLNAIAYRSGGNLVIEFDDAEANAALSASFLFELDATVSVFERASNIEVLCRQAASTFRKLTGYGQVMVNSSSTTMRASLSEKAWTTHLPVS